MDYTNKLIHNIKFPNQEETILKDIDRLMKNPKFADYLAAKMIALIQTPAVDRQMRLSTSALLDSKQFDSKNLSTQCKDVIKGWAKTTIKNDLYNIIYGKRNFKSKITNLFY